MALVNTRELSRRVLMEGLAATMDHLGDALAEGHLSAHDFSLRDLAESLVFTRDGEPIGREWVAEMAPRRQGGLRRLMEAGDAVDSTAFSNITGQIIYNELMATYTAAAFVGDRLCRTVPSNLQDGEKIAGLTGVTDDNDDEVREGMPFPRVGFGEDYIETPRNTKRGRIIGVTREMVFGDKTGRVLETARSVGEILRLRKEKKILDGVLGLTNTFKWRGTTYNTYLASGSWINQIASNGLDVSSGWQQIDAAEQLFVDMLDPDTGEPIVLQPNAILHMPARTHQFRQVVRATSLESRTATTQANVTVGPNTVDNYELISSPQAYRRLINAGETAANAKDFWFLGDFLKAFRWSENWPVTVVQSPPGSPAEFEQDIVLQFRGSEKGEFNIIQPRAVVRCYEAKTI